MRHFFQNRRFLWILLGSIVLAGVTYVFLPFLMGGEVLRAATKIVDMNGQTLYTVSNGAALELISEEDIRKSLQNDEGSRVPKYLIDALVSAEDQHFFQHGGVDIGAIIAGGLEGRGASTITTQTIKMRYFARDSRLIVQKGREFVLAFIYDGIHSKEAILAEYLNRASFGRNYIGIWSASEGYFGKVPSELSVGEAAMLIGLLPAPERYSPVVSIEQAKARQGLVLARMVEEGFITEPEAAEFRQIPVTITTQQKTIIAPHAVQEVIKEAKVHFPDIEQGGYVIHTTIHTGWHQELSEVITRDLAALADKNVSNAAAVVIEPESGAIRAMIGSKDYFSTTMDGAFNVATAKRQPGSSLKPFTYLAAFLQGMSPGTILYDIESSFETASGDPYIPRNYDLKFHGPVSMRVALGSSLNIPAVKTLEIVGFDAWYSLLRDFGIHFEKEPEFYGLGITLGGGEVTLTELTHAYSLLANSGLPTNVHLISSIQKTGQNIVYRHPETSSGKLILSDQERLEAGITMVNDILRDNSARELSFGLTSRLRITDVVAVKTGTTKDYRDNWAFGYTPKIAMGVWVGNNDNTPMEGVTGITGAIPILHDFLRMRTEETLPENIEWKKASLVQKVRICSFSNMLATDLCPYTREELYLAGTAPTKADTWFRLAEIDTVSGLLADDTCRDSVEKKVFVVLPPELKRWAESVLLAQMPTRTCSGKITQTATSFQITQPKEGDSFIIRKNLPREAQRIPVHIDGSGYLKTTLLLNDKPISLEGDLPITTFIDAAPGEHKLTNSGSTLTFSVRAE